ncbi:MAG TPA: AMP-binding protein, partial [Ilumatobacteraceae bacterium]
MTTDASIADIEAAVAGSTAPRLFLEMAAANEALEALHSMRDDGSWDTWTFADLREQVGVAAAGLLDAGVAPGERVLLMMRNRPDFHWLDIAAQFVRATPVSIYNSSSPEEVQHLASHAEARIAIVEDAGFLERILKVRGELPALERIYVLEPPDGDLPDGVVAASELMNKGSADLTALADATQPDDLATLIYTSGTTGPAKGVMIDQHNVVYTV